MYRPAAGPVTKLYFSVRSMSHSSRQPQAVQRLPLDNAPVKGKAPQGKKQQIERCPDMVHGGAADVEFRQHPTGIGYGDCRKHEDRRQQMLSGRFQEARPSLSSGCIRRHI